MKSPSILRTAHGTNAPALLVAERPPLDEIPSPNAALTGQELASRAASGKPFTRGNKAASGRKPALARMAPEAPSADPRWTKALRKANRYVKRRIRELAVQHGGHLDSAACAVLSSAARCLAASTVLFEMAGETLDPKLYEAAKKMAAEFRQAELTAIAMAERAAAGQEDAYQAEIRRGQIEYQKQLAATLAAKKTNGSQ